MLTSVCRPWLKDKQNKKKVKKEKDSEDIFKTSEMSKHSFGTFAESQNRNNDEVTPMATTQIFYLIYKEKN